MTSKRRKKFKIRRDLQKKKRNRKDRRNNKKNNKTLLGHTTRYQTIEGTYNGDTVCFEKLSEISAGFHGRWKDFLTFGNRD